MSVQVNDQNLGHATAYGYASSKGYTGTEDEFAELMASYADVAEQAAESAEQAAASATTATAKASEAAQSATAAASSKTAAETAQGGAETAAQTATTKAGEAYTAATTATNKATEATTAATTATGKATEAAGSATTATTKAGEASTSATNAAASATRAQEILDSIPEDYSQLSDDVSDLKDGLRQEQTGVVTLESGTYADANGTHKSTNPARIRNARPLPVNGLISITIPDGYQVWFFRLDFNGTLISAYGSWLSGKINLSLIATSATQYLTFAIKNTSTPTSDISSEINTVQNAMVYVRDMDVLKAEIESIPQENLSFAELIKPENLFDYTSEDMCKPGWWYYSTSVGSIVSAKQSGSTTHYVAIKVPVYDSTKITLGIYPDDNPRLVYWVGAVDADMRLIAYSIVNQNAPVTYNLPTGTVYFLASYGLGSANFATYLPKVMAINADTITKYSPYFKPYYKLLDCKTDADDSESVTKLQSIIGSSANNVMFKLPDKYDLVVGDTFQLFYKGIINAVNPDMYYVQVDCAKGNAYARYFEVTPDVSGNITATFTLYGINHNVLDTKAVTLAVHAKASSPSSVKNVLCVGDSLTTAGQWVVELHRRLTGTGGTPNGDGLTNINFIGSRIASNVHYEGYGGWTIRSYNQESVSFNARVITCTHDKTEAQDQHSIYKDGNNVQWKLETILDGQIKIIAVSGEGREFPNTGTLTWVSGGVNHSNIVYTAQQMAAGNPFWDSATSKVDFAKYATSQGVSSIDYVYVLLGWNSASWSESDYKTELQTFITNVHTSFPNAVIVFSGLEIPARDGLGVNYGANGTYSKYYELMQFVFNLDEWQSDVAATNPNTYSYNLSGQFDTEYNMITSTRLVNTRNSTEITYQSNGVHPANSGLMQIADAAYRDITGRLT